MEVESMKVLAAVLSIGLAAGPVAVAEAWIATKAMEAIGRNPSVSNDIFSRMVVAMAITESTAIYSLVISLLILFV